MKESYIAYLCNTHLRIILFSFLLGLIPIAHSNGIPSETVIFYSNKAHDNTFLTISPSNKKYLAVYHYKGIFSHAALSLLEWQVDTYIVVKSIGVTSFHKGLNKDTNLGLSKNEINTLSLPAYETGLRQIFSIIDPITAVSLLESDSGKAMFEIDKASFDSAIAKMNLHNNTVYTMENIRFSEGGEQRVKTFSKDVNTVLFDVSDLLGVSLDFKLDKYHVAAMLIANTSLIYGLGKHEGWSLSTKVPSVVFDNKYKIGINHWKPNGAIDAPYTSGNSIVVLEYKGATKSAKMDGYGVLRYKLRGSRRTSLCLKYVGSFKESAFNGEGEVRDCDNQNVLEKGIYEAGLLKSGIISRYSPQNKVIQSHLVDNFVKNGIESQYHPVSRVVLRQWMNKDGKRNGLYREHYQNGNIKFEVIYRGDQVDGNYTHYFYNGLVLNEISGKFFDVKEPSKREASPDNRTQYRYFYNHFDKEGRGSLSYKLVTSEIYTKEEDVLRSGTPQIFRHYFKSGAVEVRKGDDYTYYYPDGSILISKYGRTELVRESTVAGSNLINFHHDEDVYGNFVYRRTDGSILKGTLMNGLMNGQATFISNQGPTQNVQVTHQNNNISFVYQGNPIRVKKEGWLRRIGNGSLDAIDSIGEEFEEFMCALGGKEPGDDCTVNGGLQCDGSECTGTDSHGNKVEQAAPNHLSNLISITPEFDTTEEERLVQEAFSRRLDEGLFNLFMDGTPDNYKSLFGEPWPGYNRFEIIEGLSSYNLKSITGGQPHFGANRTAKNKSYLHKGEDYAVVPGDFVPAFVSGVVTLIGYPYGRGKSEGLRTIHIKNGDHTLSIFYVFPDPSIKVGDKVTKGDIIGIAQDVRRKWWNNSPHIHIQIKDKNGSFTPASGRYPMEKALLYTTP